MIEDALAGRDPLVVQFDITNGTASAARMRPSTSKEDTRKQPKATAPVEAEPQVRLICPAGGFLEGIRILLKENGVVAIEMPYVRSTSYFAGMLFS